MRVEDQLTWGLEEATQWTQVGRDRNYKAESDSVEDVRTGGKERGEKCPCSAHPWEFPWEFSCSFGGCPWIQMLTLSSSGKAVLDRQFEA